MAMSHASRVFSQIVRPVVRSGSPGCFQRVKPRWIVVTRFFGQNFLCSHRWRGE